jgi:hypothetical protein
MYELNDLNAMTNKSLHTDNNIDIEDGLHAYILCTYTISKFYHVN